MLPLTKSLQWSGVQRTPLVLGFPFVFRLFWCTYYNVCSLCHFLVFSCATKLELSCFSTTGLGWLFSHPNGIQQSDFTVPILDEGILLHLLNFSLISCVVYALLSHYLLNKLRSPSLRWYHLILPFGCSRPPPSSSPPRFAHKYHIELSARCSPPAPHVKTVYYSLTAFNTTRFHTPP